MLTVFEAIRSENMTSEVFIYLVYSLYLVVCNIYHLYLDNYIK